MVSMIKVRHTRKARFLSALARCEMTQTQWAEQNGYAREYLNRVLNERLRSEELESRIDSFVAAVDAKVLAA